RSPFGHPFLPVDCAGGHQAAAPETPRFFFGSLCSLAVRISEINWAHRNRFCFSRILVPEWQVTQPRFNGGIRPHFAQKKLRYPFPNAFTTSDRGRWLRNRSPASPRLSRILRPV